MKLLYPQETRKRERAQLQEKQLVELKQMAQYLTRKIQLSKPRRSQLQDLNNALRSKLIASKEKLLNVSKAHSGLAQNVKQVQYQVDQTRFEMIKIKGLIQVVVRVRGGQTEQEFEERKGPSSLDQFIRDNKSIKVNEREHFAFSQVFQSKTTQQQIFRYLEDRSPRLVQRACIIAYGQTGSGKTWTMEGGDKMSELGLVPRILSKYLNLFNILEVTSFQVYKNQANDLFSLNNSSVKSKLHKFQPVSVKVEEQADIPKLVKRISGLRKIGDNRVNQKSSRSHCVIRFRAKKHDVTLVDLAGSEKWRDNLPKELQQEAIAINKSLSALSLVLQSLASNNQRIPFKDNMLTQALEADLQKGTVVTFIINVHNEVKQLNESVRSLRFGFATSQCVL